MKLVGIINDVMFAGGLLFLVGCAGFVFGSTLFSAFKGTDDQNK